MPFDTDAPALFSPCAVAFVVFQDDLLIEVLGCQSHDCFTKLFIFFFDLSVSLIWMRQIHS